MFMFMFDCSIMLQVLSKKSGGKPDEARKGRIVPFSTFLSMKIWSAHPSSASWFLTSYYHALDKIVLLQSHYLLFLAMNN